MNKCINCGCDDAYPSLPPSPTPAECPNPQPCSEVFNAQCIIFTLPNIECGEDIVVAQDTSVAEAISSIVDYFCGKITTINASLLIINEHLATIDEEIITINNTLSGAVLSVTGLNTDNTDPLNPIVKISVDGTTITGLGTPASPLVATGGGGGSISGSGIDAYVARWTPNSTTLGTGVIRDNGTTVGIGTAPVLSYKLRIVTSGSTSTAIATETTSNDGIAIRSSATGLGLYSFGIYASTGAGATTNTGVRGDAFSTTGTTGIGGSFIVTGSGTNYGIQIQDGSQAIGKVLTCMTIGGEARWQTPTVVNLQKEITTSYTLTDADNDYTIFINNGASAITISLGAITIANFSVGFIQEGSADVTFSGAGLSNPVGLKCLGQGYQTFIERKLSTSTYYLLGNTKA